MTQNDFTSLSRREALALASAFAAVLAAGTPINAAFAGDAAAASASGDPLLASLSRMVRDLFPHDRVPDSVYAGIAAALAANPNDAAAKVLRDGVDTLNRGAGGDWRALPDAQRLQQLGVVAGTPFFATVRFGALVSLYTHPQVTALLGYEGASFEQGGYITRGFNDLDWLPEPE